ncbi:hypothetical protein DUNSADRAFT_4885 [Dunaliella salina]|uniref:Uncharacterized protein n=1 Tax=Dunaliella salina TaxID=3046 RepID=A0ABQ7GR26_DUNSA|nr:hypothetical protein DUNSADRAFT_4885 [Dunaliella salina]|eukprot:KAF5837052.1 hypothetical protein DUNSADRAFT_4885 [Dunaliella salina]
MPEVVAIYPHLPSPVWVNEVGKLPCGQELLADHTRNVERLLAYTNAESEISREPMHGLFKWSSLEAAQMWPAGSLEGLPDHLFAPKISTPTGPSRMDGSPDILNNTKNHFKNLYKRVFTDGPDKAPQGSQPQGSQANGSQTNGSGLGNKQTKSDGAESKQPLEHTDHNWKGMLPAALQADGIPWYDPSSKSGIVLAGGAVASFVSPGTQPKDFDMFLVVPSSKDADKHSKDTEREQKGATSQKKMGRRERSFPCSKARSSCACLRRLHRLCMALTWTHAASCSMAKRFGPLRLRCVHCTADACSSSL